MRVAWCLLAVAWLFTAEARAGETLYVEAGLVLPVEGEPIPNGRIVIRDGKISEVGADVERPPFSRLIRAHDLTVTPGFVVPESSIGLPSAGDRPGRADQPVRVSTAARSKAVDELYPLHRDYDRLLRAGVTTLGLSPVGTGSGIRGHVSAISTRTGEAKAMTLKDEAAVLVDCDAHGPWRSAIAEAFDKAREAAEKEDEKKSGGRKGGGNAKGGDSKDPLVRVLKKQQPIHVLLDGGATWTAARDSLPLDEAELVVLEYGRAWELTNPLKSVGARVVTSPVLVNRPRSRMPVNRAAEYERAEIPYAFRLPFDSPAGAEILRDQAIEMVRTGASSKGVLAALTHEGAKALGLGGELGAIAKGHRADLLFWSGHPLDPLSTLERIFVAGEAVEPFPTAGFRAEDDGDGA